MRITEGEFRRLTGGRLAWPMGGKSARLDNVLFSLMDGQNAARCQEVTVLIHQLVAQCLSFEQLAALGFKLLSELHHRMHLYFSQDPTKVLEAEDGTESNIRRMAEGLERGSHSIANQISGHVNYESDRRRYRKGGDGARLVIGSMIDWPLYNFESMLGEQAGHCYIWSYCQIINEALDQALKGNRDGSAKRK